MILSSMFSASSPTLQSIESNKPSTIHGATALRTIPVRQLRNILLDVPRASLPNLLVPKKRESLNTLSVAVAPEKMVDVAAYQQSLLHWSEKALETADSQSERQGIKQTVSNIKAWLRNQQIDAPLILKGFSLKSLPELPASLVVLDLSNNQFSELPTLPKSLLSLDISHNILSSVSGWPPKLMELDVSANFLSSLPAFPRTLKSIDVSDNALLDLPDLPLCLRILLANNNQLTRFPTSVMALDLTCTVDLCGNPISQQVCDQFLAMVIAGDYQGPRIYFSVFSPMSDPSRSLEDAVCRWYDEEQQLTVHNLWQAFSHVTGAVDFSRFLDKLRDSINFVQPEFKQDTCVWLGRLATDKELRELVFAIAQEGTGSCEDRATLTLNAMKSAEINLNVERGYYDDRLNELLKSARAMFRLEQLEKIARDKAATLRLVDEIEVYLAYQIRLREPLALPIPAQSMRFFACSGLKDDDFDQALSRIQKSEQKDFFNYLSTDWAPGQAVIKRSYPETYQMLQEKISRAVDETFDAKQQIFLVAQQLENNEYNRMQTAPLVLKQIAYEINGEFFRNFLQQQELTLS